MPQFSSTELFSFAMAALLIWVGVSILIAVIRLNRSYELTANRFLYPANCKPESCKDLVGFVAFITSRMIAFAIVCLLLAAFVLVHALTDLLSGLPAWLEHGLSLILFMPLFVWYVVFINQAAKRFW